MCAKLHDKWGKNTAKNCRVFENIFTIFASKDKMIARMWLAKALFNTKLRNNTKLKKNNTKLKKIILS